MARYLYSELSSLIDARKRCAETMERLNPNAVTATVPMHENEYHQKRAWFDRHTDTIERLCKDFMPSGSGFDSGTTLDLDASHADKFVFTTSYHHMTEGSYDGWTEHTVTVTPSLQHRFNLRVSGRNRGDIKEYIVDAFNNALESDVEWPLWQYVYDAEIKPTWDADGCQIVKWTGRACMIGQGHGTVNGAPCDAWQDIVSAPSFDTVAANMVSFLKENSGKVRRCE